jgi:hypothetical protein
VCLLHGTDWVFKYNSGLNENLRPAHTLYLCVLCESENKQPLFPYTTLTGFYNRDGVCLLRGTDCIFIIQVNDIV